MQGRIIRGIGGFYYVYVSGKGILECKAKGVFRKNKLKPLVGDFVEVSLLSEEGKGNIDQVLERKNELIRPAVANIDQALVIFSMTGPEPNLNLLDRFLIMMRQKEIPGILVFNKCDLVGEEQRERLRSVYEKSGCKILFVSAKKQQGIREIKELLEKKTTTVAGPSGVGKSSLINLLQSSVNMETGSISEKIQRGKHTTRHAEFIFMGEDTYILDTPGFSSLAVFDMEKEELEQYYPEFEEYKENCRFHGCSHTHEPGCRIKEAVEEGNINKERYYNYLLIYEELKNKKKY
ncbi:MAG: ribosome small subunit-dependent GTPase A [Lachnospiraceae bacterium]|nr:ribosome small subunit-dependent GTPase A [Lachnospiraceae bacterium]